MKTIPVVLLDNPQDDEVQLAGGRQAAYGRDAPVAVSRPRQPGDGIILLSGIGVAKNHLPVHIGPVKPDVIECSEDEEEKVFLVKSEVHPQIYHSGGITILVGSNPILLVNRSFTLQKDKLSAP